MCNSKDKIYIINPTRIKSEKPRHNTISRITITYASQRNIYSNGSKTGLLGKFAANEKRLTTFISS